MNAAQRIGRQGAARPRTCPIPAGRVVERLSTTLAFQVAVIGLTLQKAWDDSNFWFFTCGGVYLHGLEDREKKHGESCLLAPNPW